MPTPEWVVDELIAEAALRNAKMRRCRQCGGRVLYGMGDDWCALLVEVELTPLNPYGEMLARLAHLVTYDLHREGERWRLYTRDHWQIGGRPAGVESPGWRADVLAEHRCGWVFPAAPSVYRLNRYTRPDPLGPPPF